MITAEFLVELAVKSLLVSGAALGVLRLTRGRSAAERSWVGHAGLIALIALVPAAVLMPSWNPLPEAVRPVPVSVAAPTILMPELAQADAAAKLPPGGTAVQPSVETAAQLALPGGGELAVWTYLVPLALLVITMLIAVIRLTAMHRRASVLVDGAWLAALAHAQQRMGFKHGTALLVSDELRSPVSWGMMRPIILLNRSAVGAVHEAEPIIAHELAHVARLDWAKLLISRLACALFWFNPLVWRLARECHQLREEAADDAVLLSDVDGADYASLLVSAARHDNRALLLAAHGVAPGRDSLKRRITRVLDGNLARGPATGAWMLLCVVVLFGIAGPLAALDPMAAPDSDSPRLARVQLAGPAGAVQQAVASAIPVAVQAALHGSQAIADDEESEEAARGNPHADRMIEMRAVGVSSEYVDAMRAAGFSEASVDDLVGARAVGVTPEFAREMRRLAPGVDLDTVVGARAVGMSPSYFGEMRAQFPRITLDDAVGLAALHVTGGYVSQMRSLFPGLTADQVQELRAVNVTPDFVRAMRREGLSAEDPDEAIEGRLFGERAGKDKGPRATERGRTAIAISPGGRRLIRNGPNTVMIGPDGRQINITSPESSVAIAVAPDVDDDDD